MPTTCFWFRYESHWENNRAVGNTGENALTGAAGERGGRREKGELDYLSVPHEEAECFGRHLDYHQLQREKNERQTPTDWNENTQTQLPPTREEAKIILSKHILP